MGQIHGELREFFICVQNVVELDNELVWEIRDIVVFRKKTPR